MRCWPSAERTAGRDRQQADAEPVSAATESLFTVTGDSDLGGRWRSTSNANIGFKIIAPSRQQGLESTRSVELGCFFYLWMLSALQLSGSF